MRFHSASLSVVIIGTGSPSTSRSGQPNSSSAAWLQSSTFDSRSTTTSGAGVASRRRRSQRAPRRYVVALASARSRAARACTRSQIAAAASATANSTVACSGFQVIVNERLRRVTNARRLEVLGDERPVGETVEERLYVFRPLVSIVEVVGVLPHVAREERCR